MDLLPSWTVYPRPWAKEMKSMESERRFEEVKLDKIVPEKYASRANYNFWWLSEIRFIICLDSSHPRFTRDIRFFSRNCPKHRYSMILLFIFCFSSNLFPVRESSLIIVSNYNWNQQRGMVAPELDFEKMTRKFRLLTQMIVEDL